MVYYRITNQWLSGCVILESLLDVLLEHILKVAGPAISETSGNLRLWEVACLVNVGLVQCDFGL